MKFSNAVLMFFGMITPLFAVAQSGIEASPAKCTIVCPREEVEIYDGACFIGTTPLIGYSLQPGIHVLHFKPTEYSKWTIPAKPESLNVLPGDSLFRSIETPVLYSITSEPYGAIVSDGDSVLGSTPTSLWLPAELKSVRLSKTGYEESEVLLVRKSADIHEILKSKGDLDPMNQSAAHIESRDRNNLPVYSVAAVAVVSGVISAFFKIRADGFYDDYRRTGNSEHLSQIHSYDRISGISLAVEEVSLATLAYLLLTR